MNMLKENKTTDSKDTLHTHSLSAYFIAGLQDLETGATPLPQYFIAATTRLDHQKNLLQPTNF